MFRALPSFVLATCVAGFAAGHLVLADGGAAHQGSTTSFGSSGGNINDRSNAFCCSGTLGALVKDAQNNFYILSNNHVLARSDKAVAGEDISQPGLIDNGCRVPPIVADYAVAPRLGSNVDAAIAALRGSAMNTNGSILDIGTISSAPRTATVGLGVAKSGRTTGFTTGTVGSVNTSVNVQYQQGCGKGKKFIVSYTNQVVVNGGSFSAGGDSGSVIVTNDTSHNPVALLYAGSSTTTIGNPIGEVLSKLTAELGSAVSFVGTSAGPASSGGTLSEQAVANATAAKSQHERGLFQHAGVVGVGVGANPENPSEAAIVIYVQTGQGRPPVADRLSGVRTHVVFTDAIEAYGWNMPRCAK